MKNRIPSKKIFRWLFMSTFILLCPVLLQKASAQDVLIICNKDVPDGPLSKSALKNIFTGKKRAWSNGQKITFVTLKKGDVHNLFCKHYINKTAAQFNTYWKRMMFTGKGQMPKYFEREQEMIDFVARTEGVIGYVSADLKSDQVKILKIE